MSKAKFPLVNIVLKHSDYTDNRIISIGGHSVVWDTPASLWFSGSPRQVFVNIYIRTYIQIYFNTLALTISIDFHRGRI